MLDLVYSTSRFDFTFVNETSTVGLNKWAFDSIAAKKQNISSLIESNRQSFEEKLNTFLEESKER